MDVYDFIKDRDLAETNINNGVLFEEVVIKAAKANAILDLKLAERISHYIEKKGKNIGKDMALILLLEEAIDKNDVELMSVYSDAKNLDARAEGLKRQIETVRDKLTYNQSLMKYYRENDSFN